MNNQPSREEINRLRENYPPGTRVELIYMDDHYTTLKPGDRGFVTEVDSIGTAHIRWDSGSTLGAAYGADRIKTVPYINDTLFEQIMEVRSSGQCNMLEITAVQRYAFDHDLYELTLFLEEHRKTYAHFIFTGEREINE